MILKNRKLAKIQHRHAVVVGVDAFLAGSHHPKVGDNFVEISGRPACLYRHSRGLGDHGQIWALGCCQQGRSGSNGLFRVSRIDVEGQEIQECVVPFIPS